MYPAYDGPKRQRSHYGYHNDSTTVTTGAMGGILSNVGASGAGNSVDLAGIIGLTYKLKDRYTFGASFEPPSIHVAGGFDGNLHEIYGGGGLNNSVLTTGTGNFFAPSPARVSGGIGVKVLSNLKIEVDGSYYFPMSAALHSTMHGDTVALAGADTTSSPFDATYAVRARPTVNVGVGGEYFISPKLSVLAGASLDFSATPSLDTTNFLGAFYKERTDRVVASAGIGSYRNGGDFLVGTQLLYGWGEALVLDPYTIPNTYSAVRLQEYGAMLIIAGSTNFAALKRAVEHVEKLVTDKDPKPDAPPIPQAK